MSEFRCKQFSVIQNDDVYKITSDTTLIGAWTQLSPGIKTLEIGSGSGMISLMLAQRYPEIHITAIDINPEASKLCNHNFANSPWPDRLISKNHPFSSSAFLEHDKFDNIITNPPYHNSTTLPPSELKALAKHDNSLSFDHLISTCKNLLKKDGSLHLIIPTDRTAELLAISKKHDLFPNAWCEMFPREQKAAKRTLLTLYKKGSLTEPSSKIIMYSDEGHHPDFIKLLNQFLIIF